MRKWAHVFALGAACALASAAFVEPAAAQAPQGHGIAGFWSMSPGPTPPRRAPTPVEAELMALFPEHAVVLADAGATEFPPGDYGGLDVHARLREAAKLGFSIAIVPKANAPKPGAREIEGLTIHSVERIEQALEVVRGLA